MPKYTQRSFAAGEFASSMWGRTDIDRYFAALRRCRDMIPLSTGAARSRPPTEYRANAGSNGQKARLIPFIHSELPDQAYQLELGPGYLMPRVSGLQMFDDAVIAQGAVTYDQGGFWQKTSQLFPAASAGYSDHALVYNGSYWISTRQLLFSGTYGIIRSRDGVAWDLVDQTAQYFRTFVWTGTIWVTTSYISNLCKVSTDGITWTARTYPSMSSVRSLAYSAGKIIAAGSAVHVSTDGAQSWTPVNLPADFLNAYSIVCTGSGRWVMTGTKTGTYLAAWYSDDEGSTWSADCIGGTVAISGYYSHLATDGASKLILANGTGVYYSADNGATWTAKYGTATGTYVSACWDPASSKFFVGALAGKVASYVPGAGAIVESSTGSLLDNACIGAGTAAICAGGVDLPYSEADLPKVKYTQSGDVMFLFCTGYDTIKLSRYSHTDWRLEITSYGAARPPPSSLMWAATPTLTGDADHPYTEEWQYTCSFIVDGVETQPARPLWPPSGSASSSHKALIAKEHPAKLKITVAGNVEAVRFYKGKNGIFGYMGEVPARGGGGGLVEFTDEGMEPDYLMEPPEVRYGVSAAGVLTYTEPFRTEAWKSLTSYNVGDLCTNSSNVYRCMIAGISGFTAPTGTGTLITDGATVELARNQSLAAGVLVRYRGATFITTHTGTQTTHATDWSQAPYQLGEETTDGTVKLKCVGVGEAVAWEYVGVAPQPGNEAACGTFFADRFVLGGFGREPDSVRLSRVGDYTRFDYGNFATDDDAMLLTLASRKREVARWALGLDALLLGTNSGVWAIKGAGDNPLSPASAEARLQSEVGCADLHPLVVGDQVLYVRTKGSGVRELVFDIGRNRYAGGDITLMASHLLDGHTIIDWAWQEDPYSVVWAVRDDGKLLSLTYVKEVDVFAWALHDTGGEVESVCTTPEGSEDRLYAFVKRTVNGATVRYVERLSEFALPRLPDGKLDLTKVNCLDCSLLYDGAPTSSITGLTHLKGCSVYALADGAVQGPFTVDANGAITLTTAASYVRVGLLYQPVMELLNFAVKNEDLRAQVKRVIATQVEVVDTHTLSVGVSDTGLREMQPKMKLESWGDTTVYTGLVEVRAPSGFDTEGRVVIKQTKPYPLIVTGVTREVELGD